jgi:hypothetical protein
MDKDTLFKQTRNEELDPAGTFLRQLAVSPPPTPHTAPPSAIIIIIMIAVVIMPAKEG